MPRTGREFLGFIDGIITQCPVIELRLVFGNFVTHKPKHRPAAYTTVSLRPTHASWPNRIEVWSHHLNGKESCTALDLSTAARTRQQCRSNRPRALSTQVSLPIVARICES